jgi:hypothetical protein
VSPVDLLSQCLQWYPKSALLPIVVYVASAVLGSRTTFTPLIGIRSTLLERSQAQASEVW